MFPFCPRDLRGGQSSDREMTDISASVIPFPVFVAHFCGRAECVLPGLLEVPLLAEFVGIFCGLRFDDNIMIRPSKEEGSRIRSAAAEAGKSVQAFILDILREHIK